MNIILLLLLIWDDDQNTTMKRDFTNLNFKPTLINITKMKYYLRNNHY